jgi:DNA polymerase III subunit alpha
MPDFIHLHNHSHYSLLDGAATVDGLIKKAVSNEMDAFALTDHGNLYGVLDFYKVARANKVKPIIGCEVYVSNGPMLDKKRTPGKRNYFHLVLLAKNKEGYHNLLRLVSTGYVDGYYYRPRVDFKQICKYRKGLVATTACLAGEINQLLLAEKWDEARKSALEYREIFGDDFYLEIQKHNIPEEDICRSRMKELSDSLAIPLVVTNDIHYLEKEHVYAHDMYISVRDQKQHDPRNMRYGTDQLYFKSSEEMFNDFAEFEDACRITREIADKCNVELNFDKRHLPAFPIPKTSKSKTIDDYLSEVCHVGLLERYGENPPVEYLERLDFELNVIREMGFPGYFLIVKDFIDYARNNDIRVGPGRGSAAGSMVAYVTRITNIDPMKYDLLFERFLNPERVSMPDIDIDFEDRHRSDVIEYVRQKYGEKNVAQIITFGRMKSKAVIKDVGRVLGMSFAETDRFTKLIPDKMALSKKILLPKVRSTVPELDDLIGTDERYEEMWKNAEILEGLNRATGVHAAGVVITPGSLEEFVPLQRAGGQNGDITTQWDGNWIDDVGLLKMDFLGLRALTVIKDTQRQLANRDVVFDIETIPEDDKATFELFSRGDTVGIFQFESAGMREYLIKLQPERLDDLIAMNALYRPGPMQNIPSYIARRHGREDVSYLHPRLEKNLKVTYGIIVYQEQVMQIAQAVGGFSLGMADEMRRAMGKKKRDIMDNMKVDFIRGAAERDIPEKLADEVWALLDKFAEYGFNKSHSAAYAWLAYQTAYLKTNYTPEFLAAVMTDEMQDTKKMVVFIEECSKYDIKVYPPDVNQGRRDFVVVDGEIHFGLGAIKNVGQMAINSIVEEREKDGKFKNIFDFVTRVDVTKVNRKVMESLIQAGAFDSLDPQRSKLFVNVEQLLNYASIISEQESRNQISLFGAAEEVQAVPPSLDSPPEWEEMDRLGRERELIGIYVSGHPLDSFKKEINTFSTSELDRVKDLGHGSIIRACGMITAYRTLINKRDKKMGLGAIDDYKGSLKFMIFEEALHRVGDMLKLDALVSVKGKLSIKEDNDIIMMIDEVVPLEDLVENLGRKLTIGINSDLLDDYTVDMMERVLRANNGPADVYFRLSGKDGKPVSFRSDKFKVRISPDFLNEIKVALKGHSVVVSG